MEGDSAADKEGGLSSAPEVLFPEDLLCTKLFLPEGKSYPTGS